MIQKRVLTCAVLFLICAGQALSGEKNLRILHTNDMHAGYVPHEATWIRTDPKPQVGGFKELAWTIDSLRPQVPATFLLDAGDVMTGTPAAEYSYHGAIGGALFEMMNAMKYDAWEVGNHDLDISQDNLKALAGLAAFPTLCANLTDSLGNLPLHNRPYVVLARGGVSVGVIGIMSRELFQLTNTKNLSGLVVQSPVATAQRYVDSLRGRADVIIALTHEGVDEDSILAVSTKGINVIIGGHSHTRLKTPKTVNGVLICQTGANCENLGVLDITVDDHHVVSSSGKLLTLWARHEDANGPVASIVNEVKAAIDKDYSSVIGTLQEDWKRNSRAESSIGHFIAEAIREGGEAAIGITNTSGIRSDLSAGPIRKSDLFEVMPFRNTLCTFSMKGKDVKALVLRYLSDFHGGRTPIQISGIECTWKLEGDAPVLVSLSVGGKDVQDEQEYKCATSDFVVNQGEKYLGFVPSGVSNATETVFDLIVHKVEREKTLTSSHPASFKQLQCTSARKGIPVNEEPFRCHSPPRPAGRRKI